MLLLRHPHIPLQMAPHHAAAPVLSRRMTQLYSNVNARTKEATPLLADDVYEACMKARAHFRSSLPGPPRQPG